MLFVPLVYWSFSFIGIGELSYIPRRIELTSSGRICRSGNLRYTLLGSYPDHQQVGQQSWSFLLCYRVVCLLLLLPSSPSSTLLLIFIFSSSAALYRKEGITLTASGLATLGTNISTNSIATSNDFAFLFPKYLNIKRGAFITSILGGWVTCPWQIQKSAQSLTTFLSGYVIVLAPLLAIMVRLLPLFPLLVFFPLFSLLAHTPSFSFIVDHSSLFGIEANIQTTDYYLVRNRKLHVPMLYQNEGIYRYKGGVNWRAVVALVIVIPINLPGLINAIDKTVQTGNHKFFCMSSSPTTPHLINSRNLS
jgi:hypothetical protein